MKTVASTSKRTRRGRATLLSAQLQREICALLSQGHTVSAVCGAVGISESSFYQWKRDISQFSEATTRAIGQSKIALVDKLRQSADWRAQAFLLERRWPAEFGKTQPRVTQPTPPPVSASGTLNYQATGETLRTMLVTGQAAGNPEKIAALKLILQDVEAEAAKFDRMINRWREEGLL
jgi:transposase-like protein